MGVWKSDIQFAWRLILRFTTSHFYNQFRKPQTTGVLVCGNCPVKDNVFHAKKFSERLISNLRIDDRKMRQPYQSAYANIYKYMYE